LDKAVRGEGAAQGVRMCEEGWMTVGEQCGVNNDMQIDSSTRLCAIPSSVTGEMVAVTLAGPVLEPNAVAYDLDSAGGTYVGT